MACAHLATVMSSTGCCDDSRKQNSYIGTLGNRFACKVYTPVQAENKVFVGIYTPCPEKKVPLDFLP